eukprot:TRINITY_DN19524_c0_g1_i2.p1 TRINITY_DN19524_c0_g1~~TRINITY_DN19524_c0_g1_i2.p1  ORF type:complete len:171 (-),score=37.95 TRINITY_DN19524_c0_g1_i2:564-1076(-)
MAQDTVAAESNFEAVLRRYRETLEQRKTWQRRPGTGSLTGVELHDRSALDLENGHMQQQEQEEDVSEAIAHAHSETVASFVDGVAVLTSDTASLNLAMRDMASMTRQQGAHLDTIEAHMGASASTTDMGTQEVERANERQRKAVRNIMYLLVVALLVAIVSVIVLATRRK